MIKKVFGIYDSKAKAFIQPILMMNTAGEAIRMFETACKDNKSTLYAYPEDFMMYELAEFDDNQGIYKNHDKIVSLAKGIDYVSMKEDNAPEDKVIKE